MATQGGDQTVLAMKKIVALVLVAAGLAALAVSFNGGSTGTGIVGVLLIAAGIGLLVAKVMRRNQLR